MGVESKQPGRAPASFPLKESRKIAQWFQKLE
jgi:hypothetical protein